ncbi:MAG: TolC family protein [Desulfobacterium sp.]|nr:TolC family protein [Desulfobacterium sp.]MBU3947447.1 TolC family protein [Pseudomonadota bacterium]MBU4037758.1 TolC family protein [Pseudomonadota bacterium]
MFKGIRIYIFFVFIYSACSGIGLSFQSQDTPGQPQTPLVSQCSMFQPINIEEAVHRALTLNSDLQAIRLEEGAAYGQLEKARLFLINNPTIGCNVSKKERPEGESGSAFTNYGFKLSQEFEVAGQRSIRIDIAEKELAKIKAEIKDKERVVVADVKDAFTKVLAVKKKNGLAQEIVRLNEELLGYAKIKFQAGEVSSLNVNLSEVELSKAKKEVLLIGRECRESLLALQGFIGLSPEASFDVHGDLPSKAPALPDKEFMKAALYRRPDVKATLLEVEKTRSAKKLVEKESIPDITLSGFYDRDERRNTVGIEVSIPLPLFDRKQAEKKEAYSKAAAAKIKSNGLEKAIQRDFELAYSNLVTAIEELSLFKKEIIVIAAENLDLLNLAFKEGKVGFFEVRLAQKDTIEAQFAFIEAQERTQLALNAIEKTIGGTLE